jgi:copper resistance protein B
MKLTKTSFGITLLISLASILPNQSAINAQELNLSQISKTTKNLKNTADTIPANNYFSDQVVLSPDNIIGDQHTVIINNQNTVGGIHELPLLSGDKNQNINVTIDDSLAEKISQHNYHDHHNHQDHQNTAEPANKSNQSDDQEEKTNHDHHKSNDSDTNINQEELHLHFHDNETYSFFLVDKFEYKTENSLHWDVLAWIGNDYQRLWLKTEGGVSLDDGAGEAEIQVLYGKLISPFWDLQLGVRYDQHYGGDHNPGRSFAVLGVRGLAPYFVEMDTALFISHEGDVSARFKAEYQLPLSQKLILSPNLETNIAVQEVEEFGIGSGFNNIKLGLRLRYEISRQFAPYIGISWEKLFGDTANFAEAEGEDTDHISGVVGLKFFF